MNREEAAALLSVLRAWKPNHPIPDPDNLVKVWTMALGDIPYPAVEAAVAEWIRTKIPPFWPEPAELRVLICERYLGIPAAQEAWGEVQRELRRIGVYGIPEFSSQAVTETVRSIGWRTICLSEERNLRHLRQDFIEAFGVYRNRMIADADLSAIGTGDGPTPVRALRAKGAA